MALQDVFAMLNEQGFFQIILPFILVFTVVFAILQKVKLFGPDKSSKPFNVAIAFVMGMMFVVPHALGLYPPESDPVNIINNALPNVGIVLIAVLMALLIIGLMGKRLELGENSVSGWIALVAFAVIVFIFGNAAGWWNPPFMDWLFNNPELLALVVVILVFAIIIWLITKDDSKSDDQKFKVGNEFSKLLKGP